MTKINIWKCRFLPWVDDIEAEIHKRGKNNPDLYADLRMFPYVELAVNENLMATHLAKEILEKKYGTKNI